MKKPAKKSAVKKQPRQPRVTPMAPDYDPPFTVLKNPPAYLLRTPTPDDDPRVGRPRAWHLMKAAYSPREILVREFEAMERMFGIDCRENLISAIRHWNAMTPEERASANCPMAPTEE
ncbi:MAG TPA: hypothetical protein VHY37_08835 [Tepidisphaeraceae bacterium]|nr:hypothetical protein [Tepidisphaeraceae bacterium]